MPASQTRNQKLNLRLTASAKCAIQIAACATRRSVNEFVLESTLSRAQEMLPVRICFGLSTVQWKVFQAALDAPPRRAARLARLLREPSVFERNRRNDS
jgi:uncharacterized protein (DUF1778 family)